MKKIPKEFNKKISRLIGFNIKKIRKSEGLNQEDLGSMLNLHQSAVSRIETGQQDLTIAELIWFCSQLGIPAYDVVAPVVAPVTGEFITDLPT